MNEEYILFLQAAAAAAMQGTGNELTPLQHNSVVAFFAMLMDNLSNPRASLATSQEPYASVETAMLAPPLSNVFTATYQLPPSVPVFGLLPRPAEGEAQKWWDACSQFLQRLAISWQPGRTPGNPSHGGEAGKPAVLVGIAAEACVPLTDALLTAEIIEDPQMRAVAQRLWQGASAFAERQNKQVLRGEVSAAGPPEIAATDLRNTLVNEFAAETKRGNYMAYGTLGSILVLSAILGMGKAA